MLKKNILILVSLGLTLLMILPSQTIQASLITYDFDFENTAIGDNITAGLPSGSDNMFTSERDGGWTVGFAVTSTSERSGTRAFLQNTGAVNNGWFNATYSTSQYLTNFTFYLNHTIGTATMGFSFYNATLGQSNPIIYMSYVNPNWRYEDHLGVPHNINVDAMGSYELMTWNIDNDLGDATYSVNGGGVVGEARNPTYITQDYRIDRFYFVANGNAIIHDDWNWTLSSYYGEGSGAGGGSCSDCDGEWIGEFSSGNSAQIQSQIIRQPFNVYWNGTITSIQLQCDPAHYQYDNDESHYELFMWLQNYGTADCLELINGQTVITWLVNIECDGESTLSFEFYHSQVLYAGTSTYWQVNTGDSYTDLNGDGFTRYYVGGTYAYPIPSSGGEFKDLSMRFCVESIYTPPPVAYNDTLGVYGYEYVNDTGYVFDIDKDIHITYTLSSSSYGYMINCKHNSSFDVFPEYFPKYDIHYPAGGFGWRPYQIGKYWFILFTPSGNETVTAWVTYGADDKKENYSVWTFPNPSDCGDSYSIFAHFDSPDGTDGIIGVFHGQENANDLSKAIWTHPIEDSSSEVWEVSYTNMYACQVEYLRLFLDDASNTPVGAIHVHNVESYSIGENSVTCQNSLLVYEGNPDHRKFGIGWTHLYPYGGVYLKVQNSFFQYIQIPVGETFYEPHETGVYLVQMLINQNGTEVELDRDYCTVSIQPETPVPPDGGGGGTPFDDTFQTVGQPMGSIIGMIITIFCLLSPFMVQKGLHMSASIPMIVYAMTGGLGLSISTILGFFPIWIPLFVVVSGIIVLAFTYLKGTSITRE